MQKLKSYAAKYDIWLIVVLAFVVRVIGVRWMENTNFPEFYRDYYMTSAIAHHTQTVLVGPPSMLHGFNFGPFYYYALVPLFLLFGGHPYALILTGVIFSVLTVFVFFKLLLLWTGNRSIARVGALLMAVSVYSLHLASYTSNPNFLPLFVLWYFYHLTKIVTGKSSLKDYAWLGIALGLSTQLHATAMLILPILSISILILNKYRLRLKQVGIFLATIIVTYIPYLWYEFTHGFANIRHLFVLGAQHLGGEHYGAGARAIWNFFEGTLTPFNGWYMYTYIRPNFLYAFVALFAVIFLAVLVYRLRRPGGGRGGDIAFSKIARQIVFLWTAITCIVILLFNRGVHDHYLIILWPVSLILLTYCIFWIQSHFKTFWPLLILIVVTSLLQIYSFYSLPHTPWSEFFPTYNAEYKNNPATPRIGS